MKNSSRWIWLNDSAGSSYNIAAKFRWEFHCDTQPGQAELCFSADTFCRIRVNGKWVADGPCRAYPSHCRYDSVNLDTVLRAGCKVAELLGEKEAEQRFCKHRDDLIAALDRQWDESRHAWPDSVRSDGAVSAESSVHTSMLAILFDAVSEKNFEYAGRNTVSPSPELIPVASPFASFYRYQALEKLDCAELILEAMRRDYAPMLELGATTAWETYPDSRLANGEFPTRSHCHAWSSAPLYFLMRLILGIRSIAPGGKRFVISPFPGELQWARGVRPSAAGCIHVEWKRNGNEFHINASAPEGVELTFETNRMLKECVVFFNGKYIPEDKKEFRNHENQFME